MKVACQSLVCYRCQNTQQLSYLKYTYFRNQQKTIIYISKIFIKNYIFFHMEGEQQVFDKNYRINFKQTDKWRKYLKENGFVVIANYLDEQICKKYVNEAWAIMEKLSRGKLDKNNPETHGLGKNYPFVLHGGMIQYIGHSQMQWDLRKMCKPIFSSIWGTQELKSSFDGFCFMNGKRKYQQKPINSFLHCDQAPNKNYLWSYQGIMTLTTADEQGGGFVCVPKSNHYHHKYFTDKKMLQEKSNWYLVPDEDKNKQPLCYVEKINTQAGDFILFDSRTFHCNCVPKSDTLRVCTYICMLPKNKVDQKTQILREKAFKDKRTTCHHPADGFKMFPTLPRFVGDRQQFAKLCSEVNTADLDEVMKGLI